MHRHLPALRYEYSRWRSAPWFLVDFKSIMVILELVVARTPKRIGDAITGDDDQAHHLAWIVDGAADRLSADLAFDESGTARSADQHFSLACLAREVVLQHEVKLVVGGPLGRVDRGLAIGRGQRHRVASFDGPQIAASHTV